MAWRMDGGEESEGSDGVCLLSPAIVSFAGSISALTIVSQGRDEVHNRLRLSPPRRDPHSVQLRRQFDQELETLRRSQSAKAPHLIH